MFPELSRAILINATTFDSYMEEQTWQLTKKKKKKGKLVKIVR